MKNTTAIELMRNNVECRFVPTERGIQIMLGKDGLVTDPILINHTELIHSNLELIDFVVNELLAKLLEYKGK